MIHPILFAAHPTLFLYGQNADQVGFGEVWPTLLRIVAGAAAAWAALFIFGRNIRRSALLVSAFLVLFFSQAHVANVLPSNWEPILRYAWLVLLVPTTVMILRSKSDLAGLTRGANVAALLLAVMSLSSVAWAHLGTGSIGFDSLRRTIQGKPEHPDVYVIVLDAYGRSDVLQNYYDFDNQEFLSYLEDEGFRIVQRSRSNYAQTALTMASMFNMQYVSPLLRHHGIGRPNRNHLGDLFRSGVVFDELRANGYNIVAFSSGLKPSELETADVYIRFGTKISRFESMLFDNTPIVNLRLQHVAGNYDTYRSRIEYLFENIPRAPEMGTSPMMVFAHIEPPHPPFVFGPNGEARNPRGGFSDRDGDMLIGKWTTHEKYVAAYADQLTYVNKRVQELVDQILQNAKRPPVIILMGDHGPRSRLAWQSEADTDHREVFGNLMALHLPGVGNAKIHPSLTPVNLFRLVFREYFGGELEDLDNRSYYSTAKAPTEMIDVTDRAQAPPDL